MHVFVCAHYNVYPPTSSIVVSAQMQDPNSHTQHLFACPYPYNEINEPPFRLLIRHFLSLSAIQNFYSYPYSYYYLWGLPANWYKIREKIFCQITNLYISL